MNRSDPLARVKRAARNHQRAEAEYLGALTSAHVQGASFAELAKAAGTSRQNVRQIVRRSLRAMP